MRTRSSILLLLGPIACSDAGITKHNALPTASIVDPADGATFDEGPEIDFSGLVGDPDGDSAALTVTWRVDGSDACPDATADSEGQTTCSLALDPGSHAVSLTAFDGSGSATDDITIEVAPTDGPTVEITGPSPSNRYYADQPVLLEGIATDAEDPSTDLVASWTSTLDGDLELGVNPESDGTLSLYVNLNAGTHGITLQATDTDGKQGSDQLELEIGPANRTPTCTIAAPLDGSLHALGAEILLEGVALDDDQPSEELQASWTSDLDGVLHTGAPGAAGDFDHATDALRAGWHTLTLTVEDERETTCATSITVLVGVGPDVEITLPADGTVVNEGDDVEFAGTASDDTDASTDLTIDWSSNLDGFLDGGGADGSGIVGFSTAALAVGDHTITLSATDTLGLVGSDAITVTVNGLPTAPVVEILPDPATTSNDLVATITTVATDPEGAPLTYHYAWTLDGATTSYATDTIPASDTSRGQVWAVSVTADDGLGIGPAATDSIQISNEAPVGTSVTLDPNPAYTDDTLTASPTGTDADGDSLSWSYAWTVNGASITPTTSTLDGNTWFEKDDLVVVTATPSDSTDTGSPVSSTTLTISNTPPEAPDVEIDPASPTPEDDLVCEIVADSYDADDDSLTYTISWTVDGVDYPTGVFDSGDTGFAWVGPSTTTWTDDTVPAEDVAQGTDWTCTVIPNDGDDDGDAGSDTVTVSSQCSGETITVAWIEAWGGGHANSSLSWNHLESSWATYGDCAISIVDINQPFTLADLSASGAEVVLLADVAGGVVQLTSTEMAYIESYVQGGNAGVLVTYLLGYSGADNRQLADLAGVSSSSLTNSSSTISTTLTVVDATHPVMTNLPSSFTTASFSYGQSISGTWSSALLSGADIVAGTGSESRVVVYEGAAWNGVYITSMPEYANSYTNARQLLYNSLIWASGRNP